MSKKSNTNRGPRTGSVPTSVGSKTTARFSANTGRGMPSPGRKSPASDITSKAMGKKGGTAC